MISDRAGTALRRALRPCLALLLVGGPSGCVHVYQPLEGLHTPVVVDTSAANFTDVHLTVDCSPSSALGLADRSNLCRKIAVLFENQGATVQVIESKGRGGDGSSMLLSEDEGDTAEEVSTDLLLELRSREVPKRNYALSTILCIATATLLPAVSESPFAIDVAVRDDGGFLLASETLEGRVVRRGGVGSWVGHRLADVALRGEAEKTTRDATDRALSEDLYGQLSQLVFNAKMQWQLLGEAHVTSRAGTY